MSRCPFSPLNTAMDNASRSDRTRRAVIQAALAIIVRDGPRQLTFDAIAAESGISKGGIMHQFPTKAAVLQGLLEHQIQYSAEFTKRYVASQPADKRDCLLDAQIATLKEATSDPQSVVFAMLAAFVEDPSLLAVIREGSGEKLKQILATSADRDMSLVRWIAAYGLTVTSLVGLWPLGDEERQRVFDCLLDDTRWQPFTDRQQTPG